jgi:glyoxylase-like metal-dependent hydrolase (beta-lactamase superfamily II)
MIIDVLPAGFGDCLLVTCPVGKHTWRMLIDTGPDEVYPALKKRLSELPVAADGRRHIDLFVVTHIDHDHIGGAKLLIEDKALALSFGDIWFNAPPTLRLRGVAEGQLLSTLLGAGRETLPWNEAWSGRPVSTPANGGGVQLGARNLPRLTLLSPSPDELKGLFKVWTKELERLRLK